MLLEDINNELTRLVEANEQLKPEELTLPQISEILGVSKPTTTYHVNWNALYQACDVAAGANILNAQAKKENGFIIKATNIETENDGTKSGWIKIAALHHQGQTVDEPYIKQQLAKNDNKLPFQVTTEKPQATIFTRKGLKAAIDALKSSKAFTENTKLEQEKVEANQPTNYDPKVMQKAVTVLFMQSCRDGAVNDALKAKDCTDGLAIYNVLDKNNQVTLMIAKNENNPLVDNYIVAASIHFYRVHNGADIDKIPLMNMTIAAGHYAFGNEKSTKAAIRSMEEKDGWDIARVLLNNSLYDGQNQRESSQALFAFNARISKDATSPLNPDKFGHSLAGRWVVFENLRNPADAKIATLCNAAFISKEELSDEDLNELKAFLNADLTKEPVRKGADIDSDIREFFDFNGDSSNGAAFVNIAAVKADANNELKVVRFVKANIGDANVITIGNDSLEFNPGETLMVTNRSGKQFQYQGGGLCVINYDTNEAVKTELEKAGTLSKDGNGKSQYTFNASGKVNKFQLDEKGNLTDFSVIDVKQASEEKPEEEKKEETDYWAGWEREADWKAGNSQVQAESLSAEDVGLVLNEELVTEAWSKDVGGLLANNEVWYIDDTTNKPTKATTPIIQNIKSGQPIRIIPLSATNKDKDDAEKEKKAAVATDPNRDDPVVTDPETIASLTNYFDAITPQGTKVEGDNLVGVQMHPLDVYLDVDDKWKRASSPKLKRLNAIYTIKNNSKIYRRKQPLKDTFSKLGLKVSGRNS